MSTKSKKKAYLSPNQFEKNPCGTIMDCGKGPPKIYPHEKKPRKIRPVLTALERMKKRTNNNVNEV